jgi:hypothetical protein
MAKPDKDLIRQTAEADLEAFILLVHPKRVLGSIHKEIIRWWSREDAKPHQLLLMPRDHQKSALVAYWAAWQITKNPAIRILYISSTANLAVKQLKFIKDILTSDIYRRYWPDMVNLEEAKREKWTENEISIDHPLRKAENVRDPTVFTAGLTTTVTGLHADVQILDDVVVNENAYTEDSRKKVEAQYSLLASIAGAEGRQVVVGTRYHPKDLYATLSERLYDVFNDAGEVTEQRPLFELFRDGDVQVEDRGDGTGEFLWPRQQRADGKWFGFDRSILSIKKAQYLDQVQFRAQYYNNPNDPEGAGIKSDSFQYYDRSHMTRQNGFWYFQNNRLNVFAAVDFAYTLGSRSDYTSIVVIGVDGFQNYYILEIDRFKTDLISEYFTHILKLHQKWGFRKLIAEVTAAQSVIVKDLKYNYIARHGLALSVDDYNPGRSEGTKAERVKATLQPRYQNRQIWHYEGGNCQTLEEELILSNPPHDDIKDCLASCINGCVAPSNRVQSSGVRQPAVTFHSRFGGVL